MFFVWGVAVAGRVNVFKGRISAAVTRNLRVRLLVLWSY